MPSSRQPRKRLSPFQEQAQRTGQMVLLVVASLSRPVERSHGLICIRGFGSALGSGSRWLFQRSSASRLVDPGNGFALPPKDSAPRKRFALPKWSNGESSGQSDTPRLAPPAVGCCTRLACSSLVGFLALRPRQWFALPALMPERKNPGMSSVDKCPMEATYKITP